MMDHRDDRPDGLLEGDLGALADVDPPLRQSAMRIARDAHNMDAVLAAMAGQLSERLPTPIDGQVAAGRRRSGRKWRAVGPAAAAAAIAAVLLVSRADVGEDGEPLMPPPGSRAPSMVSEMNVEADGPFVVFPTSDPDIAVVWLLNPKESD